MGIFSLAIKIMKVEGCEYRIGDKENVAWLSLYGEVVSEGKEKQAHKGGIKCYFKPCVLTFGDSG